MGRGQASLTAIASTAAFVGIFGTLVGIATSFKGCPCGDDQTWAASMARSFAEAMVPTAWSLPIAIFASLCQSYLCTRLEALDAEMRAGTLELANSLALLRQRY
jgi:biopolymer transport protein ExbB/TolQ